MAQEKAMSDQKLHIPMEDLQRILEMVNHIHYGSVTLLIQDSRVIQIEKNEKLRLK